MDFGSMMSNISKSDVMNQDAFSAVWNHILGTWTKIYTMLTSVHVAGIPLFWWFVTFTAISVLWIAITNLSLGDASMSSVLGFGKNETQNPRNYKNKSTRKER